MLALISFQCFCPTVLLFAYERIVLNVFQINLLLSEGEGRQQEHVFDFDSHFLQIVIGEEEYIRKEMFTKIVFLID